LRRPAASAQTLEKCVAEVVYEQRRRELKQRPQADWTACSRRRTRLRRLTSSLPASS